jgi:hypothetical protein
MCTCILILFVEKIKSINILHLYDNTKGVWATDYGSAVELNSVSLYPETVSPSSSPTLSYHPTVPPTSTLSPTLYHSQQPTITSSPTFLPTWQPTLASTLTPTLSDDAYSVIENR